MKTKDSFCSCKKCVECCRNIQGLFKSYEEVQKAAEFLSLSLNDFLKKYCISCWREGIKIRKKTYVMIEFVAPARMGWEGKKEDWGYPFLRNDCVFLKDDMCIINDVKPCECKMTFGCEKHNEYSKNYWRDVCLFQWEKDKRENKIPKEILNFFKNSERGNSLEYIDRNRILKVGK